MFLYIFPSPSLPLQGRLRPHLQHRQPSFSVNLPFSRSCTRQCKRNRQGHQALLQYVCYLYAERKRGDREKEQEFLSYPLRTYLSFFAITRFSSWSNRRSRRLFSCSSEAALAAISACTSSVLLLPPIFADFFQILICTAGHLNIDQTMSWSIDGTLLCTYARPCTALAPSLLLDLG